MFISVKSVMKRILSFCGQTPIKEVRIISLIIMAIFIILEGYNLININTFVSKYPYLFLSGALYFFVCAIFEGHSLLDTDRGGVDS